jgi:hypothetical protein
VSSGQSSWLQNGDPYFIHMAVISYYEGHSKCSRNSFDIDGLVHHEFVTPGQCYFSFLRASSAEEAAWQVAGRVSFCITITHRATHRLSCHHLATVIFDLTPSDFWLFLALKMGLKGALLQPWKATNRMRRPSSGRFQQEPSAGASNSGRIDGSRERARARARVCVCVCVCKQSYIEND